MHNSILFFRNIIEVIHWNIIVWQSKEGKLNERSGTLLGLIILFTRWQMVETCHQRVKGKITDDNCDSPTILAFSSFQWLRPLCSIEYTLQKKSAFGFLGDYPKFPSFSGEGKVHIKRSKLEECYIKSKRTLNWYKLSCSKGWSLLILNYVCSGH